jgi:hypothetical protein
MFKKIVVLSLLIVGFLNIKCGRCESLHRLYEAKVLLPAKDTLLLVLEIEKKKH